MNYDECNRQISNDIIKNNKENLHINKKKNINSKF